MQICLPSSSSWLPDVTLLCYWYLYFLIFLTGCAYEWHKLCSRVLDHCVQMGPPRLLLLLQVDCPELVSTCCHCLRSLRAGHLQVRNWLTHPSVLMALGRTRRCPSCARRGLGGRAQLAHDPGCFGACFVTQLCSFQLHGNVHVCVSVTIVPRRIRLTMPVLVFKAGRNCALCVAFSSAAQSFHLHLNRMKQALLLILV